MRLQTKDIIKKARTKLLESTDEIITAEAILDYANLTYDQIQIKTRTNSSLTSATVTIASGEGTLPSGFGTFYGKPIDQDNHLIEVRPYQDVLKAASSEYVCAKYGTLVKVPTDSAITSLDIVYYASFDALTIANSPETDETFDECIIYGIMFRALEDLQDPELATYYEAKFKDMVEERSADLSSYEENTQEGEIFHPVTFI